MKALFEKTVGPLILIFFGCLFLWTCHQIQVTPRWEHLPTEDQR